MVSLIQSGNVIKCQAVERQTLLKSAATKNAQLKKFLNIRANNKELYLKEFAISLELKYFG